MNDEKYSSRLIKATALLPDTKALLAAWDLDQDWQLNFDNARQRNIFGKATRRRIDDILRIFRQRYFSDPEIGKALAIMVQGNVPAQWINPLLYYCTVENDITLRAIVLELVARRRLSGYSNITIDQVERALYDWVAEGKTNSAWGDDTIQHVAQHALATLRDFGVLQGRNTKSITPLYLPVESFVFIAFELWRHGISGEQVLLSPEWKLFFLPTQGVERFFLEAHQEKLLSYYAAGSTVRLEFPVNNLVEIAYAFVERSERTHSSA